MWPVVKHYVLVLFCSFLEEGILLYQWRHTKIILLKKPGKEDYIAVKVWRLILLLAILGKLLESVIAPPYNGTRVSRHWRYSLLLGR